jgi:hypothetical protein
MTDVPSLDRCAAYLAARDALAAIHLTVRRWPTPLADRARRAAADTVMTTAECLSHGHGTPARRRCVRAAIGTALETSAAIDVALATGVRDPELPRVQQLASRSVAMLALLYRASG